MDYKPTDTRNAPANAYSLPHQNQTRGPETGGSNTRGPNTRGPGGFTHHQGTPDPSTINYADSANRYHGNGIAQNQTLQNPGLKNSGLKNSGQQYAGPQPVYANHRTDGTYADGHRVNLGTGKPAHEPYAETGYTATPSVRNASSGINPPPAHKSAENDRWWQVPTLVFCGAFLALSAVGFGFFIGEKAPSVSGQIPTITAGATPERIPPAKPGGMNIPDRDKTVMNGMLNKREISKTANHDTRPETLDSAFVNDPFIEFDKAHENSASIGHLVDTSNKRNITAKPIAFDPDTRTPNDMDDLLNQSPSANQRGVIPVIAPLTVNVEDKPDNRSIDDLLMGIENSEAWTEGKLLQRRLGINLRKALNQEAASDTNLETKIDVVRLSTARIDALEAEIERAQKRAEAERAARLLRQETLLSRESLPSENAGLRGTSSDAVVSGPTFDIPTFGRNSNLQPAVEVFANQADDGLSRRNPLLKTRLLSGPMTAMTPFDLDSQFFDDTNLIHEAKLSIQDIPTHTLEVQVKPKQTIAAPKADLPLQPELVSTLGTTHAPVISITIPKQKPALPPVQNIDLSIEEQMLEAKIAAAALEFRAAVEAAGQVEAPTDKQIFGQDTPAIAFPIKADKEVTLASQQRPLIRDVSVPPLVVPTPIIANGAVPLQLSNGDIQSGKESLTPLVGQTAVQIPALSGPNVGRIASAQNFVPLDQSMLADPLIDSLNQGNAVQVAQLSLDGQSIAPITDGDVGLPPLVEEVEAEINQMNQAIAQQEQQQMLLQQQQEEAFANQQQLRQQQQQQLEIARRQASSNQAPTESPFGDANISHLPNVPAGLSASAVGRPYAIQIASVRKRSMINKEWQRARQKFPELLGDMVLGVEKARVKGKTYYRIQAGPVHNRTTAADLCASLKANKQACIVAKRK